MPRAWLKRHCPPKINNHVGGVGIESSKQVGNHTAKGTLSSECHIGNTWVYKKKVDIQRSLVEGTKKGSKALVESIDLIQLMNL